MLRIAIQGGGCSGFEYALGFDTGVQEGDEAIEFHGVTVVVDPLSAPYIKGATIDFVDTLQESGFKIENPNVPARPAAAATRSSRARARSGSGARARARVGRRLWLRQRRLRLALAAQ